MPELYRPFREITKKTAVAHDKKPTRRWAWRAFRYAIAYLMIVMTRRVLGSTITL